MNEPTTPTPGLPEAEKAIRDLCVGRVEWRVAGDDGAYCMSFDRDDSRDPEQEANEWLAKHQRDYPERFMPYKVRRVVVQSRLQEEALRLLSLLASKDAEIERLRDVLERLQRFDYECRRDGIEPLPPGVCQIIDAALAARGGGEHE